VFLLDGKWYMYVVNEQKKNVIVHKFLTKGTVEERIDMMLEEKSKLSQDVIASTSDSWITEMKNDELVDLFSLAL